MVFLKTADIGHRTRIPASKKWIGSCVAAFTLLFLPGVGLPAQTSPKSGVKLVTHLDPSVMNTAADPCVDFYQYACGKYKTLHPLKPNEDYIFLPDLQRADPLEQLLTLFNKSASRADSRNPAATRTQAFFHSCMDQSTIEAQGLRSIAPLMARIRAYRTPAEFASVAASLAEINSRALFTVENIPGKTSPRYNVLSIAAPKLILPVREFYVRSDPSDLEVRSLYLSYIGAVMRYLGESPVDATADAKRVIAIETAFASSALSAVNNRDPLQHNHSVTLLELTKIAPRFPWHLFLQQIGVINPDAINIETASQLKALEQILSNPDQRPMRAYLLFRLLEAIPQIYQPEEIQHDKAALRSNLRGGQTEAPRTRSCVLQTAWMLPDDTVQLYLKTFMPPHLKEDGLSMVDSMESAFKTEVQNIDWLDASTKQQALKKIDAVANIVASDRHEQRYGQLVLSQSEPLQGYLRAARYAFRSSIARNGKLVDRGIGNFASWAGGAQYDETINAIEITAADLLPPEFDPNAPDAESYGRIGFTIGHELTHGLDDKGRHFDSIGILKNWWTPEDAQRYSDKVTCFVSEYETFGIDEKHHVNGRLTLGENIADNGGLHLALLAFMEKERRAGVDINHAVDGVTPLQSFFLSYAQDTCSAVRPTSEQIQLQNNPHTLDRFRANGVVQNIPEFGQAFSCKRGQPMMPEHTCNIW